MKKLIALAAPPTNLDRYIGIRDSKHHATRQVLVANHAQISARYQALADRAADGTLHQIGASPLLGIRPQLRACYDIKTKKLLALKDEIKAAQPPRQLRYCPYCAATTNETHDHYLPSEHFPEYAVNALNLVPSCFLCNTTKDDDFLDAAGRRRFLHFYFDDIPDVDFLRVHLVIKPPLTGAGARFHIEQAGMDGEIWGLIERHFGRLKLIALYDDRASDEIGEMLEGGANYVATGGPDVRAFMRGQAASDRRIFGRNNWRAVLQRALADHPDLEGWVAAGSGLARSRP